MSLSKRVPKDSSNNPLPLTPSVVALDRDITTVSGTAQEVPIEDGATFVRCGMAPGTMGAILKWGRTTGNGGVTITTSTLDEVILPGQLLDFEVPFIDEDESQGRYTHYQLLQYDVSTAKCIVIQK